MWYDTICAPGGGADGAPTTTASHHAGPPAQAPPPVPPSPRRLHAPSAARRTTSAAFGPPPPPTPPRSSRPAPAVIAAQAGSGPAPASPWLPAPHLYVRPAGFGGSTFARRGDGSVRHAWYIAAAPRLNVCLQQRWLCNEHGHAILWSLYRFGCARSTHEADQHGPPRAVRKWHPCNATSSRRCACMHPAVTCASAAPCLLGSTIDRTFDGTHAPHCVPPGNLLCVLLIETLNGGFTYSHLLIETEMNQTTRIPHGARHACMYVCALAAQEWGTASPRGQEEDDTVQLDVLCQGATCRTCTGSRVARGGATWGQMDIGLHAGM